MAIERSLAVAGAGDEGERFHGDDGQGDVGAAHQLEERGGQDGVAGVEQLRLETRRGAQELERRRQDQAVDGVEGAGAGRRHRRRPPGRQPVDDAATLQVVAAVARRRQTAQHFQRVAPTQQVLTSNTGFVEFH